MEGGAVGVTPHHRLLNFRGCGEKFQVEILYDVVGKMASHNIMC
jgi:hypothetical protein